MDSSMHIPRARGKRSRFLIERLSQPPHPFTERPATAPSSDPIPDADLQLALTLCYELHYRGLHGVDEAWEWEPSLLAFRRELEREFEAGLHAAVEAPEPTADIPSQLRAMIAADQAPPLSAYLAERGTREEYLEFVVHRSMYQLKEADPHTWAIPRLGGRAKAALVAIQFEEYGEGAEQRMHAALFERTMAALGLDTGYGAYLDLVPGVTLATVNLMSLFGLHRRRRGALAGHLAVFEMTSTEPNRRYGAGLRRLGWGPDVTEFYDEHVEADAVHEVVAAEHLAGTIALNSPALAADVLFGAACLLHVEGRFAAHLLGSWSRGRSSLRRPVPAAMSA